VGLSGDTSTTNSPAEGDAAVTKLNKAQALLHQLQVNTSYVVEGSTTADGSIDSEKRTKVLSSLTEFTLKLQEDLDKRVTRSSTQAGNTEPWMLNKGGPNEQPKLIVPTQCTSNPAVCLAYLLISQVSDVDYIITESECPITMEVTPELEAILDGMTLCIRKGKEVTSGSFGRRSKSVDNGFAIAMAQCCISYCQEADKNRGHLMDLLPDDLKGTRDSKKAATEVFGKLRTLYKKDENRHFLGALVWLFNKWAIQYADTIGASVMRCQKISWQAVKKKAIPCKTLSKKIKGKTVAVTQFSAPKNVGSSPLLSPGERTLLKSGAHIAYHSILAQAEDEWKKLTSQAQHDQFEDTVKLLKETHKSYADTASRICGRQYKRRKYFENSTDTHLTSSKKKKVEPKALSKHLADITKKVFSDPHKVKKLPLQTSGWVLIVNTQLQDVVEEVNSGKIDLGNYFNDTRARQVKILCRSLVDDSKELLNEHQEAYESFISTNQFSALDEEDEIDPEEISIPENPNG
jgi:hypothetical protein